MSTDHDGSPGSHSIRARNEAAEKLFVLYNRLDLFNRGRMFDALVERTADYAVQVYGWSQESADEMADALRAYCRRCGREDI